MLRLDVVPSPESLVIVLPGIGDDLASPEAGGIGQTVRNDPDDAAGAQRAWQQQWSALHGEQGWRENPWVWEIGFERIA